MTDFEQGTLLTVEDVVADLQASIDLALRQRRADEDSIILVPIWELRLLLAAAEGRP